MLAGIEAADERELERGNLRVRVGQLERNERPVVEAPAPFLGRIEAGAAQQLLDARGQLGPAGSGPRDAVRLRGEPVVVVEHRWVRRRHPLPYALLPVG